MSKYKVNPFGNTKAENDKEMLSIAFYESPDYLSLVESTEKSIVVGRRGTGKSALAFKLEEYGKKTKGVRVVKVAPTDAEFIYLRHCILGLVGENYSYIRAISKMLWQYALLLEIAESLSSHYKFNQAQDAGFLSPKIREWRSNGISIFNRISALCKKVQVAAPEEIIGTLAEQLELKHIETAVNSSIRQTKKSVLIIVDKLDEGFLPDDWGIAIVSGILTASLGMNLSAENVRVYLFLRDNIYRGISKRDPDYTRNFEGETLRLHWDEYHLFNMICSRIKVAFRVDKEKNMSIWNSFSVNDVKNMIGFKKCLQLTLYRPRDLLVLLNSASNNAHKKGREKIDNSDVERASKLISENRLQDLMKEYSSILPGLNLLVKSFVGTNSKFYLKDVSAHLNKLLSSKYGDIKIDQDFALLRMPEEALRLLYSVGFIGVKESSLESYVFCHDGRDTDYSIDDKTQFLVHPCYWIALNLSASFFSEEVAEEIHDDYNIRVESETPVMRNRKIGQIISALNEIKEGVQDAGKFEDWCLDAVSILFASGLSHVELHPNKAATQRRDIVATNLKSSHLWQRIYDDYGCSQVMFEVKNFSRDIAGSEARQMLSYLCREYGSLGFIITRSSVESVKKGKELDWIREMYSGHQKLIIKLTAKQLKSWLSKIRNPAKHNQPEKALSGLLDRYVRMYLSR